MNTGTSNLVYTLNVASPSLRTTQRGMVTSRDFFLIFGAASISQEWLKLELSSLVYMQIISSLAKGMTNHPERRVVWLTCMHNSVDLEKFRHGTPLTEINDAVDDGPVFVASWMVDASAAIR